MKIKDLTKLSNLFFFSKETLRQLERDDDSLNFNLKYWKKRGNLIPVKRGFYVLRDRWEKEINKDLFLMYLANKLYEPSYISLEYVLNKYSLLSEGVYGLTSVSTRSTNFFNNDLGRFSYYSISPRLFCGYEFDKSFGMPIFVAKKTKALFDYLYFRFVKRTPLELKEIIELRINWENISSKEFKELKLYTKLSKSRRIKIIMNLIRKKYYA